jgi:hypothetical protein
VVVTLVVSELLKVVSVEDGQDFLGEVAGGKVEDLMVIQHL